MEVASVEKMAFPLPDKPSIAVLPFINMSGDPEQEYIADGITENIITALSKIPEMFVMARTSTFSYKDKPVKVKQVSEELGVRYVLEGSVQKEGDRVRITAQLIDALKGHHLWAEQYNRDMKGFFGLLDEITKEIGTALQVQLTWGDYARHVASTDNFEAWGYAIKGYDVFRDSTKRNNAKARELFEKAVELDPEYVVAWRMLGYTHYADAWMGWSKSRRQSIERTIELAQKALSIDDSYAGGHALLADAYLLTRQHEMAITEGQSALAHDPNDPLGYIVMAKIMHYSGRFEEAISMIKTGMRLHGPHFPAHYLLWLGVPLHMAGRNEEALPVFEKLLERRFLELYVQVNLAVVNMKLGREEEARKHANEVLRLNPKFSLEWWSKMELFKDPAHLERRLGPMRKAGLPDKPPLPLPDKPSIAVLPFTNISGDPEQEYFADGMTDDLITDLSKIAGLFVIARNSVFTYKGKSVKVKQIGRDLGVRYVLEGSVRKADNQVRINAQLIDTTTGGHLWAERYDGEMANIFDLQDKINQKITSALAVKLTVGEKALVGQKGTNDPAAYEEFLKGRVHYLRNTTEDFTKAEACFKRAIQLDPNYGQARAALAMLYWFAAQQRKEAAFKISYVEARLRARQYLREAMKEPTSIAYQVGGVMDLNLRQHDEAISQLEKALTLDPNDPACLAAMSRVLSFSGRPAEGLEYAKDAMRLDPLNPGRYLA
jgi:TolB-like protein/Tfp pilus assembly protein PilF